MVLKELPENEKDINRLSREALTRAGEKPDPAKLYWLQLVRWALSSGKLIGFNKHLLLFLELLEGSDPKGAMNFLEESRWGRRMGENSREEWEPVDLARFLLIHLDCCMTEKIEGYSKNHARGPIPRSAIQPKRV